MLRVAASDPIVKQAREGVVLSSQDLGEQLMATAAEM